MFFNHLASCTTTRGQHRGDLCEGHATQLFSKLLGRTAQDIRKRHEAKQETAPSSRQFYCRETGKLSGPRKPNPCQRTLPGSGKVMQGKRSNNIGSRIAPTVRRERCAPAQ